MTVRLNLIILRSLEPNETVSFYEITGIEFREEQHGNGPIHWAATLNGLVLEVYPAKSVEDVDNTTRLGFEFENIAAIVSTMRSSGIEIVQDLRESEWGLQAVARDPDGRSVELVQT